MNRLFRQDAADYIRRWRPKYEITLYNKDYETRKLSENVLLCKRGGGGDTETETNTETNTETDTATETNTETATDYFMKLTNGQHIIVGNSYIMKVDTTLNCPIYDVNTKCVISIDDDINDCYDDSDSNLTDDELPNQSPVDIDAVEGSDSESESEVSDSESGSEKCNDDADKMNIASEFEIIEDPE